MKCITGGTWEHSFRGITSSRAGSGTSLEVKWSRSSGENRTVHAVWLHPGEVCNRKVATLGEAVVCCKETRELEEAVSMDIMSRLSITIMTISNKAMVIMGMEPTLATVTSQTNFQAPVNSFIMSLSFIEEEVWAEVGVVR